MKLHFAVKQIFSKLLVPGILILISALLVWMWPIIIQVTSGETLKAFLKLFHMIPFLIFFVGAAMGARYNNSGLTLTSVTLALSYFAFISYAHGNQKVVVFEAVTFLLPLNIAFFSLLAKRKVFTARTFSTFLGIVIQILLIVLFCNRKGYFYDRMLAFIRLFSKESATDTANLVLSLNKYMVKEFATISFVIFAIVFVFLMVRFLYKKDITMAGYIGILVGAAAAVSTRNTGVAIVIYFSVSGLILVMSALETSYYMAYIDELTGLPGRRSLNETMLDLSKRYSIAMMDIDFFKKFNDNYGHETGDQVLKMIADKISAIAGGSYTFRYGGEEFTAVFPGKSVEESIPFLEKFRKIVAETPFVVRNTERDDDSHNNRNKKGGDKEVVQITISIGIAEVGNSLETPDDVIKAADKALYKAKEAGRNCVQSF
ncbi:MAG: diguanylate cyclase [Desulfobacterales bacterium]|nr:diguanylate cyclase [Desulfobacterales bacterium]MCP4163921.1 diguanylate cyclase [Deltaproteobacteria bacterium]